MTTIYEQLHQLPKGIKEKALQYAKQQGLKETESIETLPTKEATMREALENAFAWCETPEGFRFWKQVAESLTPPSNN